MTAPLLSPPMGVRAVGLGDKREVARVDAFVRAHPDATPFHLPTWIRAIERGTGQRGYLLVAERADGGLAGVLPLTAVRSPLFGLALVSSGFAVGGGALVEYPAAIEPLAAAGWALAERLGCPSLEWRGGAEPAGWAVDDTSYLGFSRPLAASNDAELAAIPRKQRAEVRKALAGNLEVVTGSSPAMQAEHYAMYAESVRNLGTPVFPRALFRAVAAVLGDEADVLTVRHQGRAVASVLSLYLNGTVYPYWGGGVFAARELRANDRMYFALMAHARARGCTRFDFGRSKTGSGPAAFKKNWGFEPIPLRYAKRVADGRAAREVNPNSPRYAAMVRTWKRLPLPVANLFGPWISRGLG